MRVCIWLVRLFIWVCLGEICLDRSLPASVELFFDSCDEMKSWMQEKDAVLSVGDMGRDLETVRALQRRHQVYKGNGLVANKITCPWISLHFLSLNPKEGSFSSLHCTKRKENDVNMFVNNYKGFYVLFPIVAKFYDI